MSEYRLYAVVSREALNLMRSEKGDPEVGKFGTQCGHAYVHAWWDADVRFPESARAYRDSSHAYKITCVVDTTEELEAIYEEYRHTHGATFVKDAGFTVFEKPTVTCVGIGPITKEEASLGSLGKAKLLRKWPK